MTDESKPTSDLGTELRNLARQLEKAIQVARESDDAQRLREDIRRGLDEASKRVDEAISAARESKEARQLGEQARRAVPEIERTIVRGLRELNSMIARALEQAEKGQEEAGEEGQQAEDA